MLNHLPRYVSVSSDTLFSSLGDEAILLHLEKDEYFGLDDVGARMWELLSDLGDIQQVVTQLMTDYDVEETILRRDLGELITKLHQAGLIHIE